jgi:hypothetical protein
MGMRGDLKFGQMMEVLKRAFFGDIACRPCQFLAKLSCKDSVCSRWSLHPARGNLLFVVVGEGHWLGSLPGGYASICVNYSIS